MHEKLNIRLANIDDIKNVFDLSNDDIVRKNSINKEKIKWEEHVKWFENKINNPDTIFYILEFNNKFTGYIRLDKDFGVWIITIHVLSSFRGQNIGTKSLNKVCNLNKEKNLRAYVKENNTPSLKCFQKAAFKICGNETINGENYHLLKIGSVNVIGISNDLYNETDLFEKQNVIYIKNKADLTFENLKKINPEYVFFPHWSYIIPKKIFENFNCIIFHMTDLPFGRGGSPLQNLISRGIYKTKISAIKCCEVLDGGDIYLKKDFDISKGSAKEIYKKGGKTISKMIDEIIAKNPIPYKQEGEIVEFKRRMPDESNIKGLTTLNQVYDYIRMLDADGYPKAFLENEKIKFEFNSAKFENGKLYANVEIKVKDE